MANNPEKSQSKQDQNKYIGKKKVLTRAEFEAEQIAALKGEPLEIGIIPESKSAIQKKTEPSTGEAPNQALKKPKDEFNPMENEPSPGTKETTQDDEANPSEQEEVEDMPIEGEEEGEDAEKEKSGEEEQPTNEDNDQPADAEEEQRLKLADRAKKFYLDKKKAALNWIKNNFSKAGIKAATGWIWGIIIAFWPYILAVLVIFALIIIIASSCSRQGGKTPTQPLEKVRDKKLVLQFTAGAGDKSAQRELIADTTISAKEKTKEIKTNNPEAQKKINEINNLLDNIVTLAGNDAAVLEKIKQILTLLDQLKQLLPDQTASIDTIKTSVTNIQKMIEFYKQGHLVVNPKDLDYVRNYDADRRVVQMLVYLITPEDQGGAGHERLKVKKIKFSYDTDRKSVSKETDYSDQDEPNISAHFSGQAADIVEIDNIKCTQIKRRRVGGSKKTKLPCIPIKVAWQSEEGYMQAGGPSVFGENMHQVFNNLASGAIDDALIEQLSDIVGVDLDPEKIKGRSFSEISKYVGTAVLKETLDIPGDYELGDNLGDIANNTGRAYLAKALNVPIEGIQGSSPDELSENIGRATIEEKMQLPAGSLSGSNSDEIFASAGRRGMEESLQLSRGTLSLPFNDTNSFKKVLGQGRAEASLGIKPQSFYGNSTGDFKKRVGKDFFEATFANPETTDNWLGIPTGTTQKLIESQISPDDFNLLVGEKVFNNELMVYQEEGKRAEAFNISADEMKKLTSGDLNVFPSIGKTTLAKTVTVSDEEQGLVLGWFNSKQLPKELDADYLGGQFGLRDDDLSKIFIDNLGPQVFQRIGQVQVLNNLSDNPQLSPYLQPVKDLQFYTDRIHIIKDNLEDVENITSDQEIKNKAKETKNIVNSLIDNLSISDAKKSTKQIQANIKFIKERAQNKDERVLEKIKAIDKATNEIIEGKEIDDFDSLSADSVKTKTDPQINLTKKDVLGLITGKKKVDDLVYSIGLRKWEIEFDLPDGSLKSAFDGMKQNDFNNPDDTLLISIGKNRLEEYGNSGGDSEQIDSNLNLPKGTTADFRAGKITSEAYNKKVGMGATNNVAAGLLNKQLSLTSDPNYALTGMDVTKLLNGGWFYTVLKIGGPGLDQALDFPAGGTMDIINQAPETPGDMAQMLAEKKLGLIAGLDRAVSLGGDVNYNLGRVKIEQELGLKPNELSDDNVVDRVRGYTGDNRDSLLRLDMSFGLKAGQSKDLLTGGIAPHDYIKTVGDSLRNNVVYDQLANYAPWLKDQDLRTAMLDLANKTGTPQEIVESAGAQKVGELIGLDYPVSIRGNFKDNLGAAKIEDRLGLEPNSFRDNIDNVIKLNGQKKFESAFYIESDELNNARNANSGYWSEDRNNQAHIVDAILNIPSGSTKNFLTGGIDLPRYVDLTGKSSLTEVTTDKLADLMDLDDKYKGAAKALVSVFNSDPSLNKEESKRQLYTALTNMGGFNLDNYTKFDPGTWENMLFVDPNDPEHTGPKHSREIVLEQGKKWLPRWMGLDESYEPYIDIIYEQGLKQWGPLGTYNEQKMTSAIQTATGIPDEYDARRFLTGDVRGGLTAWGTAQLVNAYNNEFSGEGDQAFRLDYTTTKKGYFNDPEGEKTIGDAAVQAAREKAGGRELDAASEATIRQEAIRESRDNARKDLQYRAIDMQLHKADKNIPAGFTQAMREGTSEQKWQMGITYIGNMVHSRNPNIPADILPDLQKYFDPDSPNFHNPEALSNTTYGFLDQQMGSWFGSFIQPGTAKALFTYGKTGQLGSPQDEGSLTQIYADYSINIVTNWADQKMGLPAGSTKLVYDYYTKYQAAVKAYRDAQALGDAVKIAESATALNGLKADAISFVVTTAFQKQLLAMDQSLGLVPGSSGMLVGMATSYWIAGAVNPYMIGYFVLTNLFGVYRIDVTCTACGYYPALESMSAQISSCPLGEFDGTSEDAYRTNSISGAQWKVNQLINNVLQMPKALNDDNLTPTQIMTLRQEDIDSFNDTLNDLYGSASTRMNSGLWTNKLMWDHIHIGY